METSTEPKILIVEDNPIDIALMERMLESVGYLCQVVGSAEEALTALEHNSFELAIVDIGLPGAGGDEFIEIVARQYPDTLSIVVSADEDFRVVSSVLRAHKAYDYLVKPFTARQLQEAVNSALRIGRMRNNGMSFLASEQAYYASLVETMDWKKEIQMRHSDDMSGAMINELNRTLFQGEGLGILISALDLLEQNVSIENGRVAVDKEILEMVLSSSHDIKKLSECINRSATILSRDRSVEATTSVNEASNKLHHWAGEIQRHLQDQGRKLSTGPSLAPNDRRIRFEEESLRPLIQELLVNATKYSRPGDTIFFLQTLNGLSELELKVINPAQEDRGNTSDERYEKIAFAPFMRLTGQLAENVELEEFGYGLGLTIVRKIAQLHGGSASLARIKNYARTQRFDDICATVRLPLLPTT